MFSKVKIIVSDLFFFLTMARTRHSSGNILGPSAELPDDGELFTLRDILAAAERQVELKPNSGPVLVYV